MDRGEEEGVPRTKTLPPHNEGELLQAANAVGRCSDVSLSQISSVLTLICLFVAGMADRIVYLRDLLKEDPIHLQEKAHPNQIITI